ncbi:zinc-binding alcohol dehydrogenase family protein [Derxia lacustris]|uniref:zinc-binding alcohol dehydrogenase family protein n=1 Tax=Derxia lacustris TaxID=764842 RepID=UPI000A177558|nr:zinc-binding alcohol dehydrogenase family protein [Derxia lacustris]
MKAIAAPRPLPIDDPQSLIDIDLPEPQPGPRDLLVEVRAVSVNPVDTKVRANAALPDGSPRVLGWDAAGVVRAVGAEVTLFRPGDEVWYAGDLTRPGSNAELQCVDERIVGRKPASLGWAAAAALPLTAITAWELLFDRLQVPRGGADGEALLIVGAAGGVGSVLIQLARQLTGLRVIATASRPESAAWCRELGAHDVVDHRQPLDAELARLGVAPRYIASLTQTERHFAALAAAVAPQGRIALIDDPATPPDIRLLKRKSVSLHWEFMYTRSMFQTADMAAQHRLLDELAGLVDAGVIRSTLTASVGVIDAANLRAAHRQLESGSSIGKRVLESFGG